MKAQNLLPALVWARGYSRETLRNDLAAAVIVTIMLVPQSMAYAMLAGLPPYAGLCASILPLCAYAMFGASRTLAVGPVAVISLMTAVAASEVAAPGTPEYIAAALLLSLLSGLILLAMAAFRLGFLANFLSHPVIAGFISASGVLIAVSQLKHILGVTAAGSTLPEIVLGFSAANDEINFFTLVIGVSAMAFLFWARGQLKPLLVRMGMEPRLADLIAKSGPVAAVMASIAAVSLFDLEAHGVKVVGVIPAGLPPLSLPPFDYDLWLKLIPGAALISAVGFVESVSVAQTLAAKRRQRVNANQELIGLGAANIAASVSGGYPVTGGLARSVVNFDAGAQTPLAGAFTAAGIALTAMYFTPLFRNLPQAVLAATIIVAVLSLVDIGAITRIWRYSKSDFAAVAVTIALVLGEGVEAGIAAGIMLSVLLFLWRTSRPHTAIVGQLSGTEHFRNIDRFPNVILSPQVLSLRVDESLYFANTRYLEDRVYDLIASRPMVRHVVLMCPAVNMIDASALESLEAISERLKSAGVTFHLSEIKGPVMDHLKQSDFLEHLTGKVFLSQHEAMLALAPETTALAMEGK